MLFLANDRAPHIDHQTDIPPKSIPFGGLKPSEMHSEPVEGAIEMSMPCISRLGLPCGEVSDECKGSKTFAGLSVSDPRRVQRTSVFFLARIRSGS